MIISVIKKYYKICLAVTVTLILWCGSMYCQQIIEKHWKSVSLRYDNSVISIKNIKDAKNSAISRNTKIPDITLWNIEYEPQEIKSNIGIENVEVSVIEVYGDMEQVMPLDFIHGGFPWEEDYDGCIIDEKLSYELWGTVDTIGKILEWGDKTFTVRGVFDYDDKLLILQCDDTDKEKLFSYMELNFEDKYEAKTQALNFLNSNYMNKPQVIIDAPFIAQILNQINSIPIFIIGFFILVRLYKSVYKFRFLPIIFIVSVFGAIVISMILVYIINVDIIFPSRFIPTQWSDFDFWTRSCEAIKDSIKEVVTFASLPKDDLFKVTVVINLFYLAGGIIMSFVLIRYDVAFSLEQAFIAIGVIVIIEFMVLAGVALLGRGVVVECSYWMVLPFYVLTEAGGRGLCEAYRLER